LAGPNPKRILKSIENESRSDDEYPKQQPQIWFARQNPGNDQEEREKVEEKQRIGEIHFRF
jgi:hypothetical protein